MKKFGSRLAIGFLTLSVLACQQVSKTAQTDAKTDAKTHRMPAEDGGYCIALRGNGELEPAHWGALAKTVEQLGLPQAMAGGSSASISMFLMEAVASHPLVRNQPVEVQKLRASLLLKSLLGFFSELQKTQTWADLKAVYGEYQKAQNVKQLEQVGALIQKAQFSSAMSSVQTAIRIGALDPKSAEPLIAAVKAKDTTKAQFYWQQIMETAQVFGKFNAAGDDNLFFRSGIVSFENAAVSFGKIAAFYAVSDQNVQQTDRWKKFFSACAVGSQNLSWSEITTRHPVCGASFHALFETYFKNLNPKTHPEEQEIGQAFAVYPTTTVLTGSAVNDFKQARLAYHQKLDPHFGKTFQISNPADVRFGYWGKSEALAKISQNLDSNDEKSRKFLALGPASWKTVMSLSPAEPGLSPLKEFTSQGQDYVSAGGWSDLHPVLVLKAAGCDNVVYLTRQGGESLFAQGVAKRLLNLDRDWSLLKADDPKIQKMNDDGDPSDQTSQWSRLYNLANPNSSVNHSLAKASAVLCTNWNAFDVKTQMQPLIEDSYRSAFWINPEESSAQIGALKPRLTEKKPGCSP